MKVLILFSLLTLFTTGICQGDTTSSDTTTFSTETTTAVPTTAITSTDAITTTVTPTTTVAPTTATSTNVPSSTKEPVTSPAPVTTTKVPEPADCTFNVTQGNVTCIRADFKMSFIVPLQEKNHQINLGCEAKTERSECSPNETQTLVLSEANYNLTMVFEKDASKFHVKDIVFEYRLPEGEGVVNNNSTKIFSVKTGNSYLCKTESSVHLGNVTMQISEIHVQAFLQQDEKNFGSAEECDADDKVSDVVPIAVGVALAALIIIVLIAYLVGRRRSRQKGYQSV